VGTFGLLGKSLGHSFSKSYFETKWKRDGILGHEYHLFEVESESGLSDFFKLNHHIRGLNVTVPYKKSVLPFLDQLTEEALAIGAVNCIKIENSLRTGHNTDASAFQKSLLNWLPNPFDGHALILGSGGAALAVGYALSKLKIPYQMVSRNRTHITFPTLEKDWDPRWKLIVQATPLGMYPNTMDTPEIPYPMLDKSFYLYDLVYNPEKTLFLARGEQFGCHLKNGLEMLQLQADASWQFWTQSSIYGST